MHVVHDNWYDDYQGHAHLWCQPTRLDDTRVVSSELVVGLQGWLEASWTRRTLAERDVENRAASRDIDVELPLQVGAHGSFHGDGAVEAKRDLGG